MQILLYSPKYIENVAAMGRTFEVMGFKDIYIYDSFDIFTAEMGKSNKRKLNKISSGAFQYLTFHNLDNPVDFVRNFPGRTVATVLAEGTVPLYEFKFDDDDLLMMGNETHGLPDEIVELADAKISIPQFGNTESLNLGISLGILLYEFRRQDHERTNTFIKLMNKL